MQPNYESIEGGDDLAGTVLDLDTCPSRPSPTDQLAGHIYAGRYQIEKHVASGTMGTVYLGTQLRLERPVAIKILKQLGTPVDQRFAKRFLREASIASQLAHPNIVQIYDYGETEDQQLFMVMEYLEGIPLHEVIREEAPFSIERALSIAIQIGRALRRAHAAGVVHRDLKPANVIVKCDEEGFDFVKVLDFGLVKLFAPEESPVLAPYDDDHLTRPGNMVGTPDYVSPEQAIGDEVDQRTDIYSLGVMLFQMIAGRLPFIGTTIVEMVKHHLHSPVPRICEVSPDVECPMGLELIIHRAMSKVRDDRYTTIDEMLADLKAVWREVTDESYGTGVLAMQPAPIQEPAFLVTGRLPLDPSEASAAHDPDFTLITKRPRRWRAYFALLAVVLLGIAAFSGAFCWKSVTAPSALEVEVESSVEGFKPNPF